MKKTTRIIFAILLFNVIGLNGAISIAFEADVYWTHDNNNWGYFPLPYVEGADQVIGEPKRRITEAVRKQYTCIGWFENEDKSWNDNFLCYKRDLGMEMRWFDDEEPILPSTWEIIKIEEPSDKDDWDDNYLAVSIKSPYLFFWKYSAPLPIKKSGWPKCIPIREPSDQDGWGDNFLCYEPRHNRRKGFKKLTEVVIENNQKANNVKDRIDDLETNIIDALNKIPKEKIADEVCKHLQKEVGTLQREIEDLKVRIKEMELYKKKLSKISDNEN